MSFPQYTQVQLDALGALICLDPPVTRERLAFALAPPVFTVGCLDSLVASEPALWFWRNLHWGHFKIVQSWINRPTRSEWLALKRWIKDMVPAGVIVEFRGCPRLERKAA